MHTLMRMTSWCETLICSFNEPDARPPRFLYYLLIALHQFNRLTLNVLLATYDVGKDRRQVAALQLGCCNANIKLAGVLILELKLDIILLCIGQLTLSTVVKKHLTTEFRTVLVCIFRGFLVCCSSHIKKTVHTRLDGIDTLISQLQRLPRIYGVFIDDTVNELLDGRQILWST